MFAMIDRMEKSSTNPIIPIALTMSGRRVASASSSTIPSASACGSNSSGSISFIESSPLSSAPRPSSSAESIPARP